MRHWLSILSAVVVACSAFANGYVGAGNGSGEGWISGRGTATLGTVFIACDGNSITYGLKASVQRTKSYPAVMAAALGAGYYVKNYGVSGMTTPQMTTLAATLTIGHSDFDVLQYVRTISIGLEGINDIDQEADAATAYAHLVTFYQQQHTAGFKKIIACTIFPSGTASGPQNTARQSVNTSLRANWTSYADALVDLDGDARLSDPHDTTYFDADLVHLNDTGYAVMAALIGATVTATLP